MPRPSNAAIQTMKLLRRKKEVAEARTAAVTRRAVARFARRPLPKRQMAPYQAQVAR
jgi:hypothetical protein